MITLYMYRPRCSPAPAPQVAPPAAGFYASGRHCRVLHRCAPSFGERGARQPRQYACSHAEARRLQSKALRGWCRAQPGLLPTKTDPITAPPRMPGSTDTAVGSNHTTRRFPGTTEGIETVLAVRGCTTEPGLNPKFKTVNSTP